MGWIMIKKDTLLNKPTAKVTDIAVRKAKRLIREHICPVCNNTMIDGIEDGGLGFWTCPHCAFTIYDHHLYEEYLDLLAAIIRIKISERKER
jgi:ribosomal protein L37AE/L43A